MIKDDEAPRLDSGFSKPLRNFTELCVQKRVEDRPKHSVLLKHSFVQKSQLSQFDVSQWVKKYVSVSDSDDESSSSSFSKLSLNSTDSNSSLTPRKISSPGIQASR